MPKKISQNVVRQLVQLGGEIPPEVKKQPEKITGVVEQPEVKIPQDVKLEQLKQQKNLQTRRQIAKLEQEIRRMLAQRKEQQEAWRKTQEEKMAKERKLKEEKEPKRGILGFWSRRVKTAQQQSQPERAGRRVGG